MKRKILLLSLLVLVVCSLASCNMLLGGNQTATYQVTWRVAGKSLVETYAQGELPFFKFSTERAADDKYTYEFTGWNQEIEPVTADVIYIAQYEKTEIEKDKNYTITWVIDDNQFVETYKKGETPSFKFATVKEADANYTYEFIGWNQEIEPVTANVTYIAQFNKKPNSNAAYYTVTWIVGEAKLDEIYVEGETPVYKFGTDRDADEFSYEFTGWDKEFAPVTANVTYTAQYKKVEASFTYTWVVEGVETTEKYAYGATPVYKGETPTKESDGICSYKFVGWDEELTPVTGNKVLTAVFSKSYATYEITFDVEGVETKDTFYYGAIPSIEHAPSKDYDDNYVYKFEGWKDVATNVTYTSLPKVTKEAKYTAVFKTIERYDGVKVNQYKVDGTLLGSTIIGNTKPGEFYKVDAPAVSGYVPSHDFVGGVASVNEEINIYYSQLSVWDGSSASSSLAGTGTKANPYLIQSANDLAYVKNKASTFAGKYLKMTVSVDVNNTNFMIVGFQGHFDGNNCAIRNVNITNTAEDTALFDKISGGNSVSNLSVYGTISGAKKTAGIIGYAGATITNCANFATINGSGGNVGGIVGTVTANSKGVINCSNYGTINGKSWNNGGIAGLSDTAISNCNNFGDVSSTGGCVGGVIGTTHNPVVNCNNFGKVEAIDNGTAGGLIFNSSSSINNCVNYGSVIGKWCVGGILSNISEGKSATITNCINNGSVSGTTGVGGILGEAAQNKAASVAIDRCVNNGEVTSTSWGVGGISGNTLIANVSITNCVNKGTVSAKGQIGGIAGRTNGKVENCTNTSSVTGTEGVAGGIIGELNDTTYLDVATSTNTNTGTVTGPSAKDLIGNK